MVSYQPFKIDPTALSISTHIIRYPTKKLLSVNRFMGVEKQL